MEYTKFVSDSNICRLSGYKILPYFAPKKTKFSLFYPKTPFIFISEDLPQLNLCFTKTSIGMKVQINAVGFTADNSLTEFLQKKLNKLDTFYDRIIDSEVYLKLDKGEKLNTHKKRIEVKVNLPGDSVVVKETGTTFEEATDIAMDVLTRKVKQFKEKTNGIGRRKTVDLAEEVEEED